MNRTELVEKVAVSTGLEKKQSEEAVMAVIDSVVSETKAGNKVSIFGFGTFTPSSRAARSGRNPRTGAAVKIAARNVVKFKPATAYNAALNTRSAKRSATTKKAAPAKTVPAKAAAATKTVAKKAVATTTKRVAAAKAPAKATVQAAKATAKAVAKTPAKTPAKAPAKAPAKTTTRATKATRATKK